MLFVPLCLYAFMPQRVLRVRHQSGTWLINETALGKPGAVFLCLPSRVLALAVLSSPPLYMVCNRASSAFDVSFFDEWITFLCYDLIFKKVIDNGNAI